MKKILGTLFAVAVGLVAAHYSGILTKFAIFEGQRALYTQGQLETDIAEAMPQTIGVLKQRFPADYDAMIEGLLASVKQSKNAEEIRLQGSEVVAAIRRKYASHIANAPDENLKSLISLNAQLLEEVEAGEGAAVCGAVAIIGANAIPIGSVKTYYSILDQSGAAVFLAIHAGMTAPVDHGEVSNEDWAAVISVLQTDGLSAEELDLIANTQSGDPRYCGLIIRFLKAVHTHEGAAGARVRSAFAAEIGAA